MILETIILPALAELSTVAMATTFASVAASIPVIGPAIAAGTTTLGAGAGTYIGTTLGASGVANATAIGAIAGNGITAGANLATLEIAYDYNNDNYSSESKSNSSYKENTVSQVSHKHNSNGKGLVSEGLVSVCNEDYNKVNNSYKLKIDNMSTERLNSKQIEDNYRIW